MPVKFITHDISDRRIYEDTIANGATKSAGLDIGGSTPTTIKMPGTITGTAISFEKSHDGSDYGAILDPETGANYSVPVAAGKWTPLNPLYFLGTRWIKAVSNAAEGGSRTILLETCPY